MASLRRLLIQAAVLALQEGVDDGNTKDSSTPVPQPQGSSITDAIISFLKQCVTVISTIILLFITSLIAFILFYHLVMPPNVLIKPLYFDFTNNIVQSNHRLYHGPEGAVFVEQSDHNSTHNHQTHENNHNQPYPAARADLFWIHTQWTAFNTPVTPPQRTTRILQPDQRYFLDIALTLPDSDINRDIGVFMLEASLWDRNQTLLAVSRRSAMLPYQSLLMKITRKILLMIPLLLGTVSEAQTIVVNMLDHFVENNKYPLSSVETRLLLPHVGTHHSLQIERAELRIGKELTHFQTLFKGWFFTCAFTFIIIFMVLQALGLLWIWSRHHRKKQNEYIHMHQPFHSFESDNWSHISATISLVDEDLASKNKVSDDEDDDDESSLQHDMERKDTMIPLHENKVAEESSPISSKDDAIRIQSGVNPENSAYMDQKCTSSHQRKEEHKKKKRNKVSNDKSELRIQEEECERLRRVMEGKFEPFEIFTGE